MIQESAGVVAIQGERGSFSEEAAIRLLGDEVRLQSCQQFEEVFRRTASGECDYCLIPIENSLAGSIHKNYDLLLRHGLKIVREISLTIRHNLIGVPGARFKDIEVVISHPVALDQCEKFFERNRHLTRKSAYDTSGSVKQIVESNLRSWAAVAGKRAAEVFGGQILMTGLEDNPENFTRFFLLSRKEEVTPQDDKTSIVFSFKNAAGALFKCLSVFALRDIDLSKIESRPIAGRPWEYLFYIDFLANRNEERARNALNHLREITEFLEILGCYPRDPTAGKKGM